MSLPSTLVLTNETVARPTGPLAFYMFENNAKDSSALFNTLNGSYAPSPGIVGLSGFNGQGRQLYNNTNLWDVYASSQSYTCAFWYYQPVAVANAAVCGCNFNRMGMAVAVNSSKKLYAYIPGAYYTSSVLVTSPSAIQPSQWYHVASVHNASKKTLSLYINGTVAASGSYTSLSYPVAYDYYNGYGINCSATGSGAVYGGTNAWFDTFGLWDRALTQDEITSLYTNIPLPSNSAKIVTSTVNVPLTAQQSNAQIITSNAVAAPTTNRILLLDATNTLSYPASGGGIWYDISGNNNNFNVNLSAFKTAGKYFDFNGSYGIAKRPTATDITLSGDITYVAVTRIKNYQWDWRTLTRSAIADHHVMVQYAGWDIGIYDNDGAGFIGTGYSQQSLPGYSSNTFDVMIWRWTNSDNPTYDFNVNGTQRGTITNISARYNRGFYCLGGYGYGNTNINSATQFWGDIKYFAVYNRRLTDLETRQTAFYLMDIFNI